MPARTDPRRHLATMFRILPNRLLSVSRAPVMSIGLVVVANPQHRIQFAACRIGEHGGGSWNSSAMSPPSRMSRRNCSPHQFPALRRQPLNTVRPHSPVVRSLARQMPYVAGKHHTRSSSPWRRMRAGRALALTVRRISIPAAQVALARDRRGLGQLVRIIDRFRYSSSSFTCASCATCVANSRR